MAASEQVNMEELRAGLAQLRRDIEKVAAILDQNHGGESSKLARLIEDIRHYGSRVVAGVEKAGEMGRHGFHTVYTHVHENPFSSVGAALAIGYLFALVFRHSR